MKEEMGRLGRVLGELGVEKKRWVVGYEGVLEEVKERGNGWVELEKTY